MGLNAEYRHVVRQRSVAIIGAGPAGLMAAEVLAKAGIAVTVYEKMPSPARKLLMAGRGGLNLTHSEAFDAFLGRYVDIAPALSTALREFPPRRLVDWAHDLGQPTFVGSSGRVFPKTLKASPLLRAWLARLSSLGVIIKTAHTWQGWSADGAISFATPQGTVRDDPSAVLLALGGGSWPRLGSDGHWRGVLAQRGIGTNPLQPSNCGVAVRWSPAMARHFGEPLKRIAVSTSGRSHRGEIVLTANGLEGGALYALVPAIRHQLTPNGSATIALDLRPDETVASLAERLSAPRGKQSASTFLRKQLRLSPAAIALLNETFQGKLPQAPSELAKAVKSISLHVTSTAGLDRAISSAGGLPFPSLDEHWMIADLPGVFAAGEMLDWDAPTGGYLLQACFATGVAAARGIQHYLTLAGQPTEHPAAVS